MQHYIVNKKDNDIFTLSKKDEFHLIKVMRAKLNTKIICIYQKEHFLCKVIEIKNGLKIRMIEKLKVNNENNIKINLVIGLIKKNKFDFILQKATELGVNIIIPAIFEHTIININNKEMTKKIARWNLICKEATEQSERNEIPEITNIVSELKDLEKYKSDLNLICYENSNHLLTNILNNNSKKKINSVTVIVGSEGGFNTKEIDYLKKIGFYDIKLLKQILRSETAVIYILSIINFILGSDSNE